MTTPLPPGVPTRQTAFDYDRTLVAFHGTRRETAEKLVRGEPFGPSTNDDDWLGHGIYFWEFAPQQAWWWAERRYGSEAALSPAFKRLVGMSPAAWRQAKPTAARVSLRSERR